MSADEIPEVAEEPTPEPYRLDTGRRWKVARGERHLLTFLNDGGIRIAEDLTDDERADLGWALALQDRFRHALQTEAALRRARDVLGAIPQD